MGRRWVATNDECQIDSLPQSWSVDQRGRRAGAFARRDAAVLSRLVRPRDRLIQLFDPPFDRSDLNPGYIKGYIPGVRENGGQYTHGAIWTAMGFAMLGENAAPWELFQMLNPVQHGATAQQIATTRSSRMSWPRTFTAWRPHIGRGGWTWYTGSAGWMYRLLLETLLGLNLEGTQLRLTPRFPANWTSFRTLSLPAQPISHPLTKRTGEMIVQGPGRHRKRRQRGFPGR